MFNVSCVFREKDHDSQGKAIYGPGALVLTSDQLWFTKHKPRKDLVIPLKDVITCEAETDYKAARNPKGGPFLVVTFDDPLISDVNTVVFTIKEHEDWNIDVNGAAFSARRTEA